MSVVSNSKLKILIADDEEDLREILSFSAASMSACDIFTASNGDEAIKLLATNEIDLLICDYNMPFKNGGEVYKYLLETKSQCKFVLCSSDSPSQYPEFSNRSHFFGHLEKPNLIKGLSGIIEKARLSRPECQSATPAPYIPVPLILLVKLSIMPSDIYIKLTDEKYVKVLHQNQLFDSVDFEKYSSKDIEKLYCMNSDVKQILEKIQDKIIEISKDGLANPIDANMKIHGILMSTFKEYGLQESFIPYVEAQIKEALRICSKDKNISGLLNKILQNKDSYVSTHSFLLSAVSVILATKLNWASDGPNTKLVICSLMHDVFLDDKLTNETKLLTLRKLDDDFRAHPQKAADLINKIPTMPPDTGRIILEQHEIGDEFGIPYGTNINKVTALGSLFSFCHYVVDMIIDQHDLGNVDQEIILKKMEEISEKSIQYKKYLRFLREVQLFKPKS